MGKGSGVEGAAVSGGRKEKGKGVEVEKEEGRKEEENGKRKKKRKAAVGPSSLSNVAAFWFLLPFSFCLAQGALAVHTSAPPKAQKRSVEPRSLEGAVGGISKLFEMPVFASMQFDNESSPPLTAYPHSTVSAS